MKWSALSGTRRRWGRGIDPKGGVEKCLKFHSFKICRISAFTDNLSMKEVEELTKGEFSQSMQEATGQTPIIYPASVPALILKAMTLFWLPDFCSTSMQAQKRMLLKYSAHGDLDDLAGNYELDPPPG